MASPLTEDGAAVESVCVVTLFCLGNAKCILIIGFNDCGSQDSKLFFLSFLYIFTLILVNLLVATLMTAYQEIYRGDIQANNQYNFTEIRTLWSRYDTKARGFINYK